MAVLNKLYLFNTGKYYGPDRQPIEWMVVKNPTEYDGRFHCSYHILFNDVARNIMGTIPCLVHNLELINDSMVQSLYECYQYVSDVSVLDTLSACKEGRLDAS